MNTTGSFIGDGIVICAYLLAFAVSLWVCEMLVVYGERIWNWIRSKT